MTGVKSPSPTSAPPVCYLPRTYGTVSGQEGRQCKPGRCVADDAEGAGDGNPTTPDYDAIVVGAGLGGLTTAAYLAANCQRVLLLERYMYTETERQCRQAPKF
jgi:NAD(P)-binding Rossmann-like domain